MAQPLMMSHTRAHRYNVEKGAREKGKKGTAVVLIAKCFAL